MEIVKIVGHKREDLGKKATRELRKEDKVPCTIYGKDTLVHFYANRIDFKHLIYTPEFKMAEIDVDGEVYKGIVKQTQFHPVTDHILHIDFQRLVDGRKIRVNVPVHLQGNSVGVRNGGRMVQTLRKVEIKSLPENIVAELFVDVSKMTMGDTIRVEDIMNTDKFEVMNSPRLPVATVAVPRTLKAAGMTGEEEDEEDETEAEETAEAAAE